MKAKKPSQLLTLALELLGPKGENWIKGEESEIREAGYVPRNAVQKAGFVLDREYIASRMVDLLEGGKTPLEAAKAIDKKYVFREESATYCSIGAVHHMDTPNEDKAIEYLARAIDAKKAAKGGPSDGGIITSANDKKATKFIHVRGWFKKAIAMAKKAGE